MKRKVYGFTAIAAWMMLLGAAWGQAPNLLNYQGRLTDPSGNPKTGTFAMQFAMYDALSGGNQLPSGTPWGETQSVTVTSGVFNVLLGSVTALPATMFQGGPSDSSGPLRFLQVTVSGEALTPRSRIASAAYALGMATGADASGVQVFTSSGTFTGPSGITRVYVSMVGGGGGGGAADTNSSGGGAAADLIS